MMTTQQIHAAVLHGIGQTPRYEPFPAPVAGDGEAVVTVTAAALKPSDRWMANGVHYAPTAFPQVVGLDGVGRLADGTRVAFFAPQPPYGGMAERALVRRGMWLPVPDGIDDVTAAAVTNPGMAAWKTLLWEGELAPGQTVLVLGATGTSGRIATQLAKRHGARVVAAEGPYDLIVDYLRGPPAEAVFAALTSRELRAGDGSRRIRYVQVGIAAGEVAALPAVTLRSAPIQLFGSGIGGPAALEDATAAYNALLQQVAAGQISLDVDPVPLAEVEQAWPHAGSDRRIVFVP
jgi:NADPH:quinone reductase-like Zn-dependent oxidoreductase